MKVNKAPEKIYIQPDAQDCWFMVNNLNNTLIEYTRTDAFIEKACTWLKENAANYVSKNNQGEPYLYRIGLADGFIKAMKDE